MNSYSLPSITLTMLIGTLVALLMTLSLLSSFLRRPWRVQIPPARRGRIFEAAMIIRIRVEVRRHGQLVVDED